MNVPGGSITLAGPTLVSFLGQSGAPGHLIDTAEITAVGSGHLINFANSSALGPDYFDLTITPESTTPAVPEPSTLLLLTTGAPRPLTIEWQSVDLHVNRNQIAVSAKAQQPIMNYRKKEAARLG
jgi:hypothetical protein